MPESFAPLIYPDTRILVIGSMPGEESLRRREYYGHPQNAFWRIMADVFHNGKPFLSYEEKCQTLKEHQIGLWDSLASCVRAGSMDSDIREPIANDFSAYEFVSLLLFNGQAAFKYFKQTNAVFLQNHAYKLMPSTSPAYARLSYLQKREIWQKQLLLYKKRR